MTETEEHPYACPETCRCRRYECVVCNHEGCGFCPECHPEVPD